MANPCSFFSPGTFMVCKAANSRQKVRIAPKKWTQKCQRLIVSMLWPIQVKEKASVLCGRQPSSVSTNEILTVLVEFLMLIKAKKAVSPSRIGYLAMKFDVERINLMDIWRALFNIYNAYNPDPGYVHSLSSLLECPSLLLLSHTPKPSSNCMRRTLHCWCTNPSSWQHHCRMSNGTAGPLAHHWKLQCHQHTGLLW